MDTVIESWKPLLDTLRNHLPAELTSNALVSVALTGVAGLVLALWGAKVFRAALVLGFLGAGIWGGLVADQWIGLGRWLCAIGGGLLFGAMGLVLYRLWVGVGWAIILSSVALTTLASKSAVPHWQTFQDVRASTAVLADGTFHVPSVEQQSEFNSPDLRTVFSQFGGYLAENVPNIKRNTMLIGGVAATSGLLMGLLAVRFTMILASSVLGVFMLGSAAMYGLSRYQPQLLERGTQKPAAVLAALGIAILLAMFAQWAQTRKTSTGKPPSGSLKQAVA